jgi:hypothetical protein
MQRTSAALPRWLPGPGESGVYGFPDGWETITATWIPLRANGGKRFRLIGRCRGLACGEVEIQLGNEFPDAVGRSRTRMELEERYGELLLLFRDVLRSREVWQWREMRDGTGVGAGVLREVSLRRGGEANRLTELVRGEVQRRTRPTPKVDPGRIAEAIVAALLRRITRERARGEQRDPPGSGADEGSVESLQRWLELASESQLRAGWRALQTFSVLDPACGRGERLVQALSVLTLVYDAVLERMQSHVADLDYARLRPRANRLRDFRRALEGVPDSGQERAEHIRGRVLRDNIFGIGGSPEESRATRSRLRRQLGRSPDPAVSALLRLTIRPAFARPTGAGAFGLTPIRSDGMPGERRLLHRTLQLLRHASGDADPGAWRRAISRVDGRLTRLRRLETRAAGAERREVIRSAGVPPPAFRPRGTAAPAVLFPGRVRRGFDVVLPVRTTAADAIPDLARRTGSAPAFSRAREIPMAYPIGRGASVPGDGAPREAVRVLGREEPDYPGRLLRLLGAAAPDPLYLLGADGLGNPLCGLFCSARVPPELTLPSLDIVDSLARTGFTTVGGFHTPVEREWLRILLQEGAAVVVCRARGLGQQRLLGPWEIGKERGILTLVSPFADNIRRPTLESAAVRNMVAGALASCAFFSYARPGGSTYELARTLVDWGTPVLTFDHPANRDLLRLGAEAVRSGADFAARATG